MNDTNKNIPDSTNQMNSNKENDPSLVNKLESNGNTEKQIPLNDTKENKTSTVIKYVVQDGESIHNISKKFSISKDLIRSSNHLLSHHLHPGDTLKIYLGIEPLNDIDPIEVIRFDQDGKTNHIKGKLILKDYELTFHPHSIMHHPTKISIFGYLESSIVQNPSPAYFQSKNHRHSSMSFKSTEFSDNTNSQDSEGQSVLSIEYLNDDDILVTDYYIGTKEDIEKFQNKLNSISTMTKKTPEIYNPDKINTELTHSNSKVRPHHNSLSFDTINKLNNNSVANKSTGAPPQIPVPEEQLPEITINGKSSIFKENDIPNFRKLIPKLYRDLNWRCLFQTRIHGYSLSTLFNRIAKKRPLLLFIKTIDNEIIGAFIYDGLKITDKYYGNYETFVFRFQPKIESFHWNIRNPKSNRYFILSNLSSISFGASSEQGEGSALFIQNDLNTGFSEECNTYGSPQLTKSKKFIIEELEIWEIISS